MNYYVTYGELQEHLKSYYMRTGNRLQFIDVIQHMYKQGQLKSDNPATTHDNAYREMTDEEFEQFIDSITFTVIPTWNSSTGLRVQETDIIPNTRDVFVIRHPRYTRPQTHMHNYFEVDFVARGECSFTFEQNTRTLREGEVCIIAPSSEHDLTIVDDSTIITIMIRKSTFDTTFFSLLSQKDLLSYFFRTILQGDNHANYLLFFTSDNQWIKKILHNLFQECSNQDSYSNNCCINWVNLFFSTLLRNYSQTIQFYNYQMGADFSLILQYIQYNYQTLSLSTLAEIFHYSEPHLSTLIKQNTGFTFTELIKRLRLSDAVDYLINTDMKISEIAEQIGYNSADHFSRVFRSSYQMSPLEYRKQNQASAIHFDYK
ncbi:AraC family transcriptional regulator [Anaerosporobacter sp.]|uniref:AraC family transcriptional regulator n=1 Tax=Anaerosporobacter sp. TaxID=1872529 RepID=UPI00286F442A|nr:AraC family transcriptional regulator [Anaerosporobacter sp.]